MNQDELIAAIERAARQDRKSSWHPTVSADAIDAAEDILGLKLPTTLVRIYRELTNGGIGPGFGLGGLPGGHECPWAPDLIAQVQDMSQTGPDDELDWEDGWLPLIDWG